MSSPFPSKESVGWISSVHIPAPPYYTDFLLVTSRIRGQKGRGEEGWAKRIEGHIHALTGTQGKKSGGIWLGFLHIFLSSSSCLESSKGNNIQGPILFSLELAIECYRYTSVSLLVSSPILCNMRGYKRVWDKLFFLGGKSRSIRTRRLGEMEVSCSR